MRAPPAPLAEPARIDALDGVRGLAILLVVLMHAMLFGVPLQGVAPQPDHPYWRVAALGWCGVDVFFVLSGFLITGILLRSKGSPRYFRNFYARRALRIFPLYYAVIVLLLFVLPRPPATGAEQASYLLYYQNVRLAFVPEQHFDGAREITWSLAIEEQFYLLWPAVVWLASRRALVGICVATIVLAVATRWWLVELGGVRTHFLTPCRLDTLAAGALLAPAALPPRWLAALALAGGAAGLIAAAAWTGSPLPELPRMQLAALPAALVFAVGIVALARGGGAFARACSIAPLRSLGRYSYCVYLVHFLVVDELAHALHRDLPQPWQHWLGAHLSPTALLLAFTALCVGASWAIAFASWHLYEKHFLALKRHFSTGSMPAAPIGSEVSSVPEISLMRNLSLTEYECQRLVAAMIDTSPALPQHTSILNGVLAKMEPAMAEWEAIPVEKRNATITFALDDKQVASLVAVMDMALHAQQTLIQTGRSVLPAWKHDRVLTGMRSVLAKLRA